MFGSASERSPLLPSSQQHEAADERWRHSRASQLRVFLFFFVLVSVLAASYVVVGHLVFPLPVEVLKSPFDSRIYSHLMLDNGMSVLLVEDRSLTQSGAAMAVNVGYYNDPADVPGLAHFTEHEMFAGSKKYPNESHYFNYILGHGGRTNAFTKEEETNFYFRVHSENLAPALDIFAQFFIAPRFAPSRISREMHAIEAEHRLRTNSDDRRRYEILALCSSPYSPLHHYGTGDIDTLNRTDIRQRLMQFHDQWYSANHMKLVLIGPQPISAMKELVETSFSTVPNKNLQPLSETYDSLPFDDPALTGKIVFIEPVLDSHIITLYWQQPPMVSKYLSNPGGYLSFLLQHKSEGSLQHTLKSRGLITFLTASSEVDASAFTLYHVRIGLTETGLYYVDSIIDSFYDYLYTVTTAGILESIERERIEIERLSFLYSESADIANEASELASGMLRREVPDLLNSPQRRKFDAKEIRAFLERLKPRSALILLSSANFTHSMFRGAQMERYYQIPFLEYRVPDAAIQRWTDIFQSGLAAVRRANGDQPHFSLLLPNPLSPSTNNDEKHRGQFPFMPPTPNPYIPQTFDIVNQRSGHHPKVIYDDAFSRVWLRPLAHQSYPFATIGIEIRSPLLLSTVKNQAFAHLYAALVTESFQSIGYQAQLAGYRWTISVIPRAIRVTLQGFNGQLPAVLHRLVEHMANPSCDSHRFATVKSLLLERRDNIFLSLQPYAHALYLAQLITEQNKFPDHEITNEAEKIREPQQIFDFIRKLFSESFVEMFGFGNVNSEELLEMRIFISSMLNASGSSQPSLLPPLPQSNLSLVLRRSPPSSVKRKPAYRVYEIPPGRYLYQYPMGRSPNINSACYVSIFAASYHRVRSSAILKLMLPMIQPFCFDYLRSKLQLGYIVRCFTTIHFNTVQSFDVLIQGSEHDSAEMDEKIELMIAKFEDVLLTMSDHQFESVRAATITSLLSKPPSYDAQFTSDWSHVVGLDHHFNRSMIVAAELRSVNRSDVINFYRSHILPNPNRRRLSVEIFGAHQTPRIPGGGAEPTAIITEDNRQGTKEKWRVYKTHVGGEEDTHDEGDADEDLESEDSEEQRDNEDDQSDHEQEIQSGHGVRWHGLRDIFNKQKGVGQ